MGSKWVKHTQVLGELAYCRLSLTSRLHGPRVLLTIPKTFDDLWVLNYI